MMCFITLIVKTERFPRLRLSCVFVELVKVCFEFNEGGSPLKVRVYEGRVRKGENWAQNDFRIEISERKRKKSDEFRDRSLMDAIEVL